MSETIKRWHQWCRASHSHIMAEHPRGEFVASTDFDTLAAENARLREELRRYALGEISTGKMIEVLGESFDYEAGRVWKNRDNAAAELSEARGGAGGVVVAEGCWDPQATMIGAVGVGMHWPMRAIQWKDRAVRVVVVPLAVPVEARNE